MKKVLTFILIFVFMFMFVSCDSSTTTSKDKNTTSQTETTSNTTDSQDTTETTVITTDSTEETVVSTEETTETTEEVVYDRFQTINLYSMNDFHGGTYSDISKLENIGGYLKSKLADDTNNTVLLSNGDIFQGSAISNYYYGEPIVEVFNEIGFDGFVIGNHEFDWGIDKVLNYKDGNSENGEMNCPILAANIVYQDTQLPLENTVPYIIKEVSGVKVGVIGLIGEVIDSISASRVENIEFKDPLTTVETYAYDLRVNQEVDIVVVYIHESSAINDYTPGHNEEFANLTGDYLIDAVFNGHTHRDQADSVVRYNYEDMYYAQASNKDYSLFAHISLIYDTTENKVVDGYSETISYNSPTQENEYLYNYSDQEISNIIYKYENDVDYQNFITEELAFSNDEYSQTTLASWAGSVIRDYLNIDAGAVNSGGFRHSIPYGTITMGDMIETYPFDNYVKTCDLTGYEFEDLYNSLYGEGVYWDDQVEKINGVLYIKGEPVVGSQIYTIGAVDYIFDKDYYGFLDGDNITLTTYLMRDLLVEDLKNNTSNFNPYNGTSFDNIALIYDPNLFKELILFNI